MHIEHINITASADLLEKVRDFYCRVFGLVVGYRPDFTRAGYWLYDDGNPIIHLTVSESVIQSTHTGCFDHFAIQSTRLKNVVSRLEDLQIEYSVDHLREIGMTQLFFRDPSGVGVEANFKEELEI